MYKKSLLFFIVFIATHASASPELISLIKKTASVYSGSIDVDVNNPGRVTFETTMHNQKVYLSFRSNKLNSSVYSILNTDQSNKRKMLPPPPIVYPRNLDFVINNNNSQPSSCTTSVTSVTGPVYSCAGINCDIKARIISKANELSYWPIPKDIVTGEVGAIHMDEKIDISDCLPNSVAGSKYTLEITTANHAPNVLAGTTLQYVLTLQNDSYAGTKK